MGLDSSHYIRDIRDNRRSPIGAREPTRMSRTVVNWRQLPPTILDFVDVQGAEFSLVHSKRSKTVLRFTETTRMVDAFQALVMRQSQKPAHNAKITGFIKLCEHIKVENMQLGPLLGEVVSRHLNQSKPRAWIRLADDLPKDFFPLASSRSYIT